MKGRPRLLVGGPGTHSPFQDASIIDVVLLNEPRTSRSANVERPISSASASFGSLTRIAFGVHWLRAKTFFAAMYVSSSLKPISKSSRLYHGSREGRRRNLLPLFRRTRWMFFFYRSSSCIHLAFCIQNPAHPIPTPGFPFQDVAFVRACSIFRSHVVVSADDAVAMASWTRAVSMEPARCLIGSDVRLMPLRRTRRDVRVVDLASSVGFVDRPFHGPFTVHGRSLPHVATRCPSFGRRPWTVGPVQWTAPVS